VDWEDYPFLQRPLDWPMGCIFYDIPSLDGNFHGVTTNSAQGQGVVYYSPEESAHYTKIWSWGKQGADGNQLEGRPASDYYEPWSGATNFAFFQTSAFEPQTELSWEIAILPIAGGLMTTSSQTTMEELHGVVETHIDGRMDQLGDIRGVQIRSTITGEELSAPAPAPVPAPAPAPAPTSTTTGEDSTPPPAPTPTATLVGLTTVPPATTTRSDDTAAMAETTSASLQQHAVVPSCCYCYYSWASTLVLLSSLLLFGQ